jgi:MerR family transcriptional regulator/heat shock protein HspR
VAQKQYSRHQIAELLQVDESFLVTLEEEDIIISHREGSDIWYTTETCERVRVARELIHELEVNVQGAAIIMNLRDQLYALRKQFYATLDLIRDAAVVAERRRGGR